MKKIVMYIDSNNFYNQAKNVLDKNKASFRWGSLIGGMRDMFQEQYDETNFVKAVYYSALADRQDNPERYDKQKKFLDAIGRLSFVEVRLGHLARVPKIEGVPVNKHDPSTYKHVEKRTDSNMSNDVSLDTNSKSCEIVLLVGADSDHLDCVEKAKKHGAEVFLILPEGTKAWALINEVGRDNVFYLNRKFLEKHLNS